MHRVLTIILTNKLTNLDKIVSWGGYTGNEDGRWFSIPVPANPTEIKFLPFRFPRGLNSSHTHPLPLIEKFLGESGFESLLPSLSSTCGGRERRPHKKKG
jgi:hypothetical protein